MKREFKSWYSEQRRAAKEIAPDCTFKNNFGNIFFRSGYGSLNNGLSRTADDFMICPDRQWHDEFNRNVARTARVIRTGSRRKQLVNSLEYMRRCRIHAEQPRRPTNEHHRS